MNRGVYIHPVSPFYWIRYYDILEPDPKRRSKSINTKIPVSDPDRKRYIEAKQKGLKPEIKGTPDLWRMLGEFKSGLNERNITAKSGIKFIKKVKLSDGFQEFVYAAKIPRSKEYLRPKTLQGYETAVTHFINSCEDKYVHQYTKEKDFPKLLYYFDNLTYPVKRGRGKITETEYRKMSATSLSIYTRALKSLWNYFIEKGYTKWNIIDEVEPEEVEPDPIPPNDMYKILQAFKKDDDHPEHYHFIYMMLLCCARPSTIVVQEKDWINFSGKIMKLKNVKAGKMKSKKKEFYYYPLYKPLLELLTEMEVQSGKSGRIFPQFKITDYSYTNSLKFWNRKIDELLSKNKIARRYKMKQVRPTMPSFLINILNIDIFTVQKLMDHADIKITQKHYAYKEMDKIREQLDDVDLEMLKDSEYNKDALNF